MTSTSKRLSDEEIEKNKKSTGLAEEILEFLMGAKETGTPWIPEDELLEKFGIIKKDEKDIMDKYTHNINRLEFDYAIYWLSLSDKSLIENVKGTKYYRAK